MDDGEKTPDVAGGASQEFDPDKTWAVPSTPRAGVAGADPDPEKTHVVPESPVPPRAPAPRPAAASGGQYPPAETHSQYPAAGPTPRPEMGPRAQYPTSGPQAQRPQPTPPAPYGPPAGPAPLPGPPPAPWPPNPPANYGPPPGGMPPNATPTYGSGPQQPPPDYGQPGPYPQQPPFDYSQPGPSPQQPPLPPQSPMQAANSALAKGSSFIARLIHRGMYGELIKNPWFQNTRRQSPDQFVYIGFGVGVVMALILGQIGGLIGDILTLAMWAGLAYTFFAIGTKKAVQFVAYGICGIGAVLYGGGALLGMLAWSSLSSSPYLGGTNIGTIILLQSISSAVFAVALGWAGVSVHRTIKKLSQQ